MDGLPSGLKDGLQFERSNWSQGSIAGDPFYKAPQEATDAPPGTLLKLEESVDTAKYLLPPTTSLSRFIYQSETLNGSKVPVSSVILWPFSPRSQPDGFPIVAWAHGTSGFDANAAPSHHKNLWQHFLAPFQIALQGYVVVATDYAGLGVQKHPSGEPIVHEYLTPPSQAKDLIYSVKAAREAFSKLSKQFVVIGHSQGGGAAWSVAQRAATTELDGFLGAIGISPYTSLLEEQNEFAKILAAAMCPGLASAFPDFSSADILTEEGERRLQMVHETSAAISSAVSILSEVEILKPDWKANAHFQRHQRLTSNGGRAIKGPLLLVHGLSDPILSATVVESAVRKTIECNPQAQIQYVRLPNITHVSALPGSQHLWMDWIGDRFAGRKIEPFQMRTLDSPRPHTSHQIDQNWYLAPATQPYHAPGP